MRISDWSSDVCSSDLSAYWAIKAGEFDTALAVGFDKHPRGSFNPDPEKYGLPQWYGDTGLMLTTQFFALKIQRYMHDHGISARTLARVRSEEHTSELQSLMRLSYAVVCL